MRSPDLVALNRRHLLARLGALGAGSGWLYATGLAAQTPAASERDAETLLRSGGCVLMLRHAQTEAGIGDPPDFNLAQCSTQRNLSDAGRVQSRQIGQWFEGRRLRPRQVASSPWCRCKETAELAFGRHTVLPALASTFDDSSTQATQTRALRALLATTPAGQFDVWVTHQVNITALTGEGPSMGEAVIVGRAGQVLLRARLARQG
jgi:phosphohistidine phosphatase SixA